MALNATMNWYVRAGGNVLNGGGFDSAVAGAGTNYCDQDAPQLSLTDLATSGVVATVTSAAGLFTAAMVGNVLRLASGTNATAGYYTIVTYTNATTIVLDRAPCTAAMTGGTGRIGGAFATPWGNLQSAGTITAPTIASPLAAGHTVNIRGAGLDIPVAADYTMPAPGYSTYPVGNVTAGYVRFVGYNGRPRIDTSDMFIYDTSYCTISNFFFHAAGSYTYPEFGMLHGMTSAYNCIFEQNGIDRVGVSVISNIIGCKFQNSGASTAATHPAIKMNNADFRISGCYINGWRGSGIDGGGATGDYGAALIFDTVVANCKSATIPSIRGGVYGAGWHLINVTVYGGLSDCLELHSALYGTDDFYDKDMILGMTIYNCLFISSGGYGINFKNGSTTLHNALRGFINHNGFYNNTSGKYNRLADGPNDVTLTADPFVSASTGDFSLNGVSGGGAACKNIAFPTSFPSS